MFTLLARKNVVLLGEKLLVRVWATTINELPPDPGVPGFLAVITKDKNHYGGTSVVSPRRALRKALRQFATIA